MELGRWVPEITGAKRSSDHILYLFRRVDTRIVFRTHWYLGLFVSFTGKETHVHTFKKSRTREKKKTIHFNMKNVVISMT